MLYEYAVEPEAIARDWTTFRNLIDKFGFDRGRAISRFPKRWEAEVIEHSKSAGMPDVQQKRVVELLKQAKDRALLKSGRDYNPDVDWLPNAIASHGTRPFQAIISKIAETTCDRVVQVDDVEDGHALIAQPVSIAAARTVEGLSAALLPMLMQAREMAIVDPYFDIRNPGGQDFRGPIQKLLADLHAAGKRGVVLKIHFRTHDTRPPENIVRQQAGQWLAGVIPDGFSIELHEWQERPNAEVLHDRFLLCDCGGLQLGHGFQAVGGHQTVNITRLDFKHSRGISASFDRSTGHFDLVYPVVTVNCDGRTS